MRGAVILLMLPTETKVISRSNDLVSAFLLCPSAKISVELEGAGRAIWKYMLNKNI
jgi:hypothetical protein